MAAIHDLNVPAPDWSRCRSRRAPTAIHLPDRNPIRVDFSPTGSANLSNTPRAARAGWSSAGGRASAATPPARHQQDRSPQAPATALENAIFAPEIRLDNEFLESIGAVAEALAELASATLRRTRPMTLMPISA